MSFQTKVKEDEVKRLKRRLGHHRRRLNYWSGNPSVSGYGPTGKNLQSERMDEKYEIACHDAISIAEMLASLGCNVEVVDVRETFRHKYFNKKATDVLMWPKKEKP